MGESLEKGKHDKQGKVNEKSTMRVWALTSLGTGVMVGVDLGLIYAWLASTGIAFTGFLIAIGLVTFLGMLMISSYHSEHHPKHHKSSTGVMRRALTVSFVVVYFVVFSVIVFDGPINIDDQNSDNTPTSENQSEEGMPSEKGEHEEDSLQIKINREVLLDHLTTIMIVILGFYFGTKGVNEIVKTLKPNGNNDHSNMTHE